MGSQDFNYNIDSKILDYKGKVPQSVFVKKTQSADLTTTFSIQPIRAKTRLFAWLQDHSNFFNKIITSFLSIKIRKDADSYIFDFFRIKPLPNNDAILDDIVTRIALVESPFFFNADEDQHWRKIVEAVIAHPTITYEDKTQLLLKSLTSDQRALTLLDVLRDDNPFRQNIINGILNHEKTFSQEVHDLIILYTKSDNDDSEDQDTPPVVNNNSTPAVVVDNSTPAVVNLPEKSNPLQNQQELANSLFARKDFHEHPPKDLQNTLKLAIVRLQNRWSGSHIGVNNAIIFLLTHYDQCSDEQKAIIITNHVIEDAGTIELRLQFNRNLPSIVQEMDNFDDELKLAISYYIIVYTKNELSKETLFKISQDLCNNPNCPSGFRKTAIEQMIQFQTTPEQITPITAILTPLLTNDQQFPLIADSSLIFVLSHQELFDDAIKNKLVDQVVQKQNVASARELVNQIETCTFISDIQKIALAEIVFKNKSNEEIDPSWIIALDYLLTHFEQCTPAQMEILLDY